MLKDQNESGKFGLVFLNKSPVINSFNSLSTTEDFEILYPLRGKILDKNDIVKATNKNTYDLFLIPEQNIK